MPTLQTPLKRMNRRCFTTMHRPAALFRPTATTLAPASAKARPQRRPMPLVAPVTRHTRPSQRKAMLLRTLM